MEKIVSRTAKKSFLSFFLICLFHYSYAQNNDIKWLRQINAGPSANTDLMQATSNSAYLVSVAVPFTQLLVGYIRHDTSTILNGWQTAAGLGLSVVISVGTKYIVHRDRPSITYPDIIAYQSDADPSFPSSHTAACFSIATSLSIEYPKWYVIVPSYAWASTVGYSRMYLGAHYPSDVVAGAVTGAGSAWLSYKCTKWLQHSGKLKGGFFKWILRK